MVREQNLWGPLDRRTPTTEATPKGRHTLIKYLLKKGSYGLGAGPVRYLGTPGTIESFDVVGVASTSDDSSRR
jgi:hypothetical protein